MDQGTGEDMGQDMGGHGDRMQRGVRGHRAGCSGVRDSICGTEDVAGAGTTGDGTGRAGAAPGGPRCPGDGGCPQRQGARTACGTWTGTGPGTPASTASSSPSAAARATSGTAAVTPCASSPSASSATASPSAPRPSRASPRPWCSSSPSSPPSSAASCAPAATCTSAGSTCAPPCKAQRFRCPATPPRPPQPPSPWTPKPALRPPSLASPPWPCTHRLPPPPSTHCTPPAPLSTTPQHLRPMSRHSPATLEPETLRGLRHPPPAASQHGWAGDLGDLGDPGPPAVGPGGAPVVAGSGPSWPSRVTPRRQHRAALFPHTGPFVVPPPRAPTGGTPGGPLRAVHGCTPAHPRPDSAAPGSTLNHVLCPTLGVISVAARRGAEPCAPPWRAVRGGGRDFSPLLFCSRGFSIEKLGWDG